jgi:hypothetical protein
VEDVGFIIGIAGEAARTRTSRRRGRAGGYGLSRTDAERGSSGAVDDSQCGTPDDPSFYFFYSEVVEGPKVLCLG